MALKCAKPVQIGSGVLKMWTIKRNSPVLCPPCIYIAFKTLQLLAVAMPTTGLDNRSFTVDPAVKS